jgi:hypothetical protein
MKDISKYESLFVHKKTKETDNKVMNGVRDLLHQNIK